MQPTRLANACGDASPATKTRRQMKPKTASQHQSEPDEATDSSVEASSGRCTPAVVGMPPPLASAVLPPQILTVDAGYVALSWSPPIWDVSTDNTVVYGVRYRVLIATVLGNADTRVEDVQCYQCVYEGIETSTQVAGLLPGRMYAIRVSNSLVSLYNPAHVFDEQLSPPVLTTTPPGPPYGLAAPTLAKRTRNSLKVCWQAPTHDGGRAVVAYMLFVRPPPTDYQGELNAQGFARVFHGQGTSHKLVRLRAGHTYHMYLQCCNIMGFSEPSPTLTLTTSPSVPSTPNAPTILSRTSDSVTLRWVCPEANGEAVTSFVLEGDYGDGGAFHLVYNGPAVECCITRLEALTSYRFRVAACNSVGISLWSPLCIATTLEAPSSTPSNLKLVSCNQTTLMFTWQPPAHHGIPSSSDSDVASPDTTAAYQLELKAHSRAALQAGWPEEYCVAYEGLAAACSVSNLRAGCTYLARVRTVGDVLHSEEITVMTTADCPDEPDAPWMCGSTTDSLQLAWQPPVHDGGAALTGYHVELRKGGDHAGLPVPSSAVVYRGVDTHCIVRGLHAGQDYQFRLRAVNPQGASPWSRWGLGATQSGPPAAPRLAVGECTTTAVCAELAWQVPACHGARIEGYHLQLAGGEARTKMGGPMSRVGSAVGDVHALSSGEGDAVSSASDTSSGERLQPATPPNDDFGAQRAPVAAARGPPGPRQGPLTSPSTSALSTVSQSTVTEDLGLPHLQFITAYQGAEPRCVLTGLNPAMQYWVRVKAINTHGSSPWSEVLSLATTAATPPPPEGIHVTPTSASTADVQWKAPLQQYGCPPQRYQVEAAAVPRGAGGDPKWALRYTGDAMQCTLDALAPGRAYCVRVRASNAKGWGAWGAPVMVTTLAGVPGTPAAPVCGQRTSTSVRLQWLPPDDDGGMAVCEYRLDMQHIPADTLHHQINTHHDDKDPSATISRTASSSLSSTTTPAPTTLCVYSGTSLSTKVTDLHPGACYAFTVTAVNTVGCSNPSSATTITTPLLPPPAPSSLHIEECEQGLRVVWNMPENMPEEEGCVTMPRASVSGYELEVVKTTPSGSGGSSGGSARGGGQNSTKQLVPVTAKHCHHMLPALGDGVHCQLRVRALGNGGGGAGPWSSVASVTHADRGSAQSKGGPVGGGATPSRRSSSKHSMGGVQRTTGGATREGPSGGAPQASGGIAVAKPPPRRRAPLQRAVQWAASWALCFALCAAGLGVLYAVVTAQE